MRLNESILKNLRESDEEKKFRISWGYNRNEHTGDYEDSGEFDIMAKDEDDAERKAYRKLDQDRIPYDEFWVQNVSDAEVFGIEYLGKWYNSKGLESGRDPETERLFVAGSEDEVKKFSRELVGKFIADRNGSAYKCLKIKDVYIAMFPKSENTPDVNDPDVFEKVSEGFKPLDISHQKELQDKILEEFKARVKEEHYKGRVEFEMDDSKIDNPGYIGTICIYAWNITNGDRDELEKICKENGCTSTRDRNYEAMSYYCFAITEDKNKEEK